MFPGLPELPRGKQEIYRLQSSVPEEERYPVLEEGIIIRQDDKWWRGTVCEVEPADSTASKFTTKILLQPGSLHKRPRTKNYITMQLGPDNFGSEVEYGHVWFKVVDKSIHERQKMLQFDACLQKILIHNKLDHGKARGDGHCFFHCLSQIVFRVDTIEYITALRRLFGDSLPAMETQIFDLAQRNGVMFEQDSRESMQREFKESIT